MELELEQFLGEHGVNICLLNETHLELSRTLMYGNNFFLKPDHATLG
jgi:hypothetical protein